jgi:hypothetical protein
MSLLDDLNSLDLSAVVDARATITATIEGAELQTILDGGAVASALGDLGDALAALGPALDDPTRLLAPLAEALGGLAERLGLDELPLADYAEAVTTGASALAELLGGLDDLEDDPLALSRLLGRTLPDALDVVTKAAGGSNLAGLDELQRFRRLVATAEAGLAADPRLLAEFAVDVLTPFPRDALARLRSAAAAVLGGVDGLVLPDTRTAGLRVRLDAVATAAAGGDAAALRAALADLERTRAQTVEVIKGDLHQVMAALGRLPVGEVVETVAATGHLIDDARTGVLELLEQWRAEIATARAALAAFDPAALPPLVGGLLDQLDRLARERVVEPIDRQADLAVEWARSLLRELPVRELRARLSTAIHTAAVAVDEADLDAPAERVRELAAAARDALDVPDLAGKVQAAVADVKATLDGAVEQVIGALGAIKAAVDQVAGEAREVLERAAQAVAGFQQAVDRVTAAVESLDLRAPTQEVLEQVRAIRETVEGPLSLVPLPESLAPLVAQLVDQLEALRLDAGGVEEVPLLGPVLDAVGTLSIDDTVAETVNQGLETLRDKVANLIPAALVEDIGREVRAALDTIASFDPAALLDEVTAGIDRLANDIEGLDLVAAVAPLRGPFLAVLELWDKARPSRLLAPVVAAYDGALKSLPLPNPEAAVRGTAAVLDAAGERLGQAAVQPVVRLAPEGTEVVPPGGPAAGPPAAPDTPVRVGDVVRLFAYLPAKLREVLAELEAGAAGQVLREIDAFCGGLARDLRAVRAAAATVERGLDGSIDRLLAPLADAQLRAQLALVARFGDGDGAVQVDVQAALDLVAQAGPGSLRAGVAATAEETRARVRGAAAPAEGAAQLDQVIRGLEECSLAGIVTDLDALLAALDPEPLAAELDGLVHDALAKAPQVLTVVGGELEAAVARLRALVGELNPGAQAQKLLRVVGVLREELDVLNPRRLAAELDEVHAAVRAALEAYDPAALAAEAGVLLDQVAAALRGLDPAALLGDLGDLRAVVEKARQADPTTALTGVGAELAEVGEVLAGIDLDRLLGAVEGVAAQVRSAFLEALEAIRAEVVALLRALRFAAARVGAEAEVSG